MPEGLTILEAGENIPAYTLTVYDANGNIQTNVTHNGVIDGQTTTWMIEGVIEPDAKLVLTYTCEFAEDAESRIENENKLYPGFRKQAVAYGISDFAEDAWMSSDMLSCILITP